MAVCNVKIVRSDCSQLYVMSVGNRQSLSPFCCLECQEVGSVSPSSCRPCRRMEMAKEGKEWTTRQCRLEKKLLGQESLE